MGLLRFLLIVWGTILWILLLLDCWWGLFLKELRLADWNRVFVSSFECNTDFEGLHLDGVKAVSLMSFDGSFGRAYARKFGLRDEVRVVGNRRIEDVLALLQGGVSNYSVVQLLFMNLGKIDDYFEATKFQNRFVGEAVEQMRRMADAVIKASTTRV
jgi:hypothetical protein